MQQWSSFLMGKHSALRESKSAQECILLMVRYLAWYSFFSRSKLNAGYSSSSAGTQSQFKRYTAFLTPTVKIWPEQPI